MDPGYRAIWYTDGYVCVCRGGKGGFGRERKGKTKGGGCVLVTCYLARPEGPPLLVSDSFACCGEEMTDGEGSRVWMEGEGPSSMRDGGGHEKKQTRSTRDRRGSM